MNIQTVVEKKRGCGYREPGGLYLRTDGIGRLCGALPIEMVVCPTCHQGIKPARGWTWVNIAELAAVGTCTLWENVGHEGCGDCPIADAKIQKAGLLWVGEKFYKTPGRFAQEAVEMGISRRITMVPRGLKVGETWVALAHRKAIDPPHEFQVVIASKLCDHCGGEVDAVEHQWKPGIFHIFKPQRIEYVVKEFDLGPKLEAMEKRGITLVRVERDPTETEGVTK